MSEQKNYKKVSPADIKRKALKSVFAGGISLLLAVTAFNAGKKAVESGKEVASGIGHKTELVRGDDGHLYEEVSPTVKDRWKTMGDLAKTAGWAALAGLSGWYFMPKGRRKDIKNGIKQLHQDFVSER